MPNKQAWPEQLVLRLDDRSLRGFAKLRRGAAGLQVFVPYTSPALARIALAQASALTRNLTAHITFFAVHVVPFSLPLDKPDVTANFLEQKLAGVARETGAQTDIRIVFARDPKLGYEQILMPHSLIVMATKKRWWPTAEVKMARALARAGHSVAILGA